MRAARVLAEQLATPVARSGKQREQTEKLIKNLPKAWSELTSKQKDDVLCVVAIRFGWVEEE